MMLAILQLQAVAAVLLVGSVLLVQACKQPRIANHKLAVVLSLLQSQFN
jgi:hypothetical protein